MKWETEQLINQLKTHLQNEELAQNQLRAEVTNLQAVVTNLLKFVDRAEPFIKTMELIASKEKPDEPQVPR